MTKAEQAIRKARLQICMMNGWQGAFYGTLAMNLTLVETGQVPTMATDGVSLYFNPEYTLSLPEDEIVGVVVHEALHCGLCHHVRMLDKPLIERNVCFDYPVNEQVTKAGFKIPGNLLFNRDYFGKSAEQLHPILYPAKPASKPEADSDPGESDGQEGSEAGQSGDGSEAGQEAATGDAGKPEAGQAGEDSGDTGKPASDAPTGNGEGQEAGDGQPGSATGDKPAGDGQASDGSATGDKPAGATAGTAGEGQAGEGQLGTGTPASGQGNGQEAGQENGQATGDGSAGNQPGEATAGQENGQANNLPDGIGENLGVGGVLPAPIKNEADRQAEQRKWETVVRQAASLATARNAGNMPDIAGVLLTNFERSRIDWREQLATFIDSRATSRETWKRPDRRFAGRQFVLPGRTRDGISKLVWAVDVSGSMDHVAFDLVAAEIRSAFEEGRIAELIIVYTNTAVVRVDTFERGDDLEINPPVGGGTDFAACMNWINENAEDATAIVFFTDLIVYNFGQEPDCPVLWLQYGSYNQAKVPFGEIVPLS